MAFEIEEMLGVTLQNWVTKNPIDIKFIKNKFASKLWKRKRSYDGGRSLDFPVIIDQGVALVAVNANPGVVVADGSTVDNMSQYGLTAAEKAAITAGKKPVIRTISLPWKKAVAEVDIEANILTMNRSDRAVVKLIDVRLSNARKGVQYDMANFLFTHTGVLNQWHGLPLIMSNLPYGIDENGAAVAPLLGGQFANWKPTRVIASSQKFLGAAIAPGGAGVRTITIAAHGLATGDLVYLSAFNDLLAVNEAQYAITVTTPNTFTVVTAFAVASVSCTVDKAASLSTAQMEELWSDVTDYDSDEKPDAIMLSKLQYRLGKGRLDLQYMNRDGNTLETSVKGYSFMGVDFDDESRMPDHTLYMLNSKYLHYGVTSDKSRQGNFKPFVNVSATTADREDVFRTQAWIDANIICERRPAHGMVVNLLPR